MFTIHLDGGPTVPAEDFKLEPGWVIAMSNDRRRVFPERRVVEITEN